MALRRVSPQVRQGTAALPCRDLRLLRMKLPHRSAVARFRRIARTKRMSRLPAHLDRTGVPKVPCAPEHRRATVSVKVLLIQKHSAARVELGAALREEGFSVVEAEDGAELREFLDSSLGFARRGGVPDLLIVDTDLVGKPGLEVLADLRRTYQHIPVILLSESFNKERVREAGALDAAYLFEKPCDTEAAVLAALTLVDPGQRTTRATALRWLLWHQGGPPTRH